MSVPKHAPEARRLLGEAQSLTFGPDVALDRIREAQVNALLAIHAQLWCANMLTFTAMTTDQQSAVVDAYDGDIAGALGLLLEGGEGR